MKNQLIKLIDSNLSNRFAVVIMIIFFNLVISQPKFVLNNTFFFQNIQLYTIPGLTFTTILLALIVVLYKSILNKQEITLKHSWAPLIIFAFFTLLIETYDLNLLLSLLLMLWSFQTICNPDPVETHFFEIILSTFLLGWAIFFDFRMMIFLIPFVFFIFSVEQFKLNLPFVILINILFPFYSAYVYLHVMRGINFEEFLHMLNINRFFPIKISAYDLNLFIILSIQLIVLLLTFAGSSNKTVIQKIYFNFHLIFLLFSWFCVFFYDQTFLILTFLPHGLFLTDFIQKTNLNTRWKVYFINLMITWPYLQKIIGILHSSMNM